MKFNFQNKEMLDKIEKIAGKFFDQFGNELELAKNDQEYYDLIMGSMVFKELIAHNFKMLMGHESEEDVSRLILEWEQAAKQIAEQIYQQEIKIPKREIQAKAKKTSTFLN